MPQFNLPKSVAAAKGQGLASIALLLGALSGVTSSKIYLKLLDDPLAKCMDGTKAGYYYEPASGKSDTAQTGWVIHLQGGGECTDEASCGEQVATKRGSSNYWDDYLWELPFLASSNVKINSGTTVDWNHVFIPYCSQDLHSGQVSKPSEYTYGYYFSGHLSFAAIIKELTGDGSAGGGGLGAATKVVLSGDSAGGIATWINVDWLQEQLPQAHVVGAPIAGFYFFSFPYTGPGHTETLLSDMSAGAWAGNVALWNSFLPAQCAEALGQDAPYCMLSNYSAPYIAAPMFVIEAQSDCVQLVYHDWLPSSAREDADEDLRAYMVEFQMNQTQGLYANLKPEDGWFNPACYIHTEFNNTNPSIGGISYVGAFNSWLSESNGSTPLRLMDYCGDDVFCNEACSFNRYC